jgi:type I restriction enzyme S subunit
MKTNTKSSGIEWIGDIPHDWEVKRHGFLFTFGKGLGITKEDLQDEGIPCVSYGEIHSKYGFEVDPVKNSLRCVDEKYLKTDRNSLLKYGDFIFADTSEDIEGSGNFTYLNSDEKTFAGYHTIIIRLIENLSQRYIAYFFDSISFRTQIREKVWGIKVYSITKQILKNTKVIIPYPDEQKAIAAFLDTQCGKIDSIIAELEQQIEILKQYKTSLITETVTKGLNKNVPMKDSGIDWIGKVPAHWEVIRLKYLLKTSLQYGANEVGIPPDNENPRYIRITDITIDGKLKEDEALSLELKIAKPYILVDKDLLFARSGATVGKTFYYESKYGISAFAGYLIRASIKQDIQHSKFLYYYTLGNKYEIWKSFVFTQATIPNISADKYNDCPIICPPLSEQKTIASFLDKKCEEITSIIEEKQLSIDTMKAYKKSLIYEYVTGKKRV